MNWGYLKWKNHLPTLSPTSRRSIFYSSRVSGNLLDLISEYQQYEEASGDDDAEYEEAPRLTPRTTEGSEEGGETSTESPGA